MVHKQMVYPVTSDTFTDFLESPFNFFVIRRSAEDRIFIPSLFYSHQIVSHLLIPSYVDF